jgi:predicted GTPase
MKYGAGVVAARKYGAKELVDPRPFAVGTIADAFKKYPEVGTLLPALGYSDQQIKDLQDTIDKVDCDLIIIGTPIDLRRIVKLKKPAVRVRYELQEIGKPDLKDVLKRFSC